MNSGFRLLYIIPKKVNGAYSNQTRYEPHRKQQNPL
jgi:hypothetical protein